MPTWPRRLDTLVPKLDRLLGHAGLTVRKADYDVRLVDPSIQSIISRVQPFTMTEPLALVGLIEAIDYICESRIPGCVVECGVWRGGSAMAAALRLASRGDSERPIWLYDTFDGMTRPTAQDVRVRDGMRAELEFEKARSASPQARADWFWAAAPVDEVQANLKSTNYPEESIHYIVGPVEETIPEHVPDSIAVLRLDTDWYESTSHELAHLLPRLVRGGVLIVDDYHYWKGSRTAVDEYFAAAGTRPLFARVGTCAVMAVV